MKIKSFPKSHYERVSEFLKTIINVPAFLDIMTKAVGDDPSHAAFTKNLLDLGLLKYRENNANTMLMANILFHVFLMKKSCDKIYYVTPQLAVKLAQTDLNVDSHFIRSPFREIYIQIDAGLFTITDVQGTYPVRGFYVYLGEEKGGVKEVRIMASALLPNSEEIAFNDSIFYYKLYFEKGKIKEQVKSNIEKNVLGKLDEVEKFGGKQNIDHIEEFTYFVFNTLLYITSKDPDIRELLPIDFKSKIEGKKSAGKIRKLQKVADRSTSYPVLIVGDSITDEKNQVEEIRKAGGVGNWKLTIRVYVSGHWKTQWYGSAEAKESKLIFIEPYYKGPELADVINKKYQVGANI